MMQSVATYCRICEAACGLRADLDDDGRLIKLRPDKEHPVSHGFVCAKGLRFGDVAAHPRRVLTPLGPAAPSGRAAVGWPEATRTIAARLRAIIDRHGPHAASQIRQ